MSSHSIGQSQHFDIGSEAVVDYLTHNPDFFDHHPEVLAALEVPHASGDAVSLIERQVQVLRAQLTDERQRLSHLIARAKDYEQLNHHLHALILQIIGAQTLERLYAVLRTTLAHEFHAETVALELVQLDAENDQAAILLKLHGELTAHGRTYCGTASEANARRLFGATDPLPASVALIAVQTERHAGILAIGSSDPQRFRHDMGTDLLDRLGEIVCEKLRLILPSPSHGGAN